MDKKNHNNTYRMKINNPLTSITNLYNKSSNWGKILFLVLLLLLVVAIFKPMQLQRKEGFEQQETFLLKTNDDLYDKFYAEIYDELVFNNLKDDYEVGEIINKTDVTSQSIILDIGSGTGHHVAKLKEQGFNAIGVDKSTSMVEKSKQNFPDYKFLTGDVEVSSLFKPNSFTHILCLYFTIYYMKDKNAFFQNCMNWLMPGGYLVLHLVERDNFDPILPPGNPFLLVSPQRYAKERITQTKLIFNDMEYTSNFSLDNNKNIATFEEKFKNTDTGKVRKNEHTLYMDTDNDILTMAQNNGFIVHGKIDLISVAYEYQYLYILTKPN
jgi:SAM-dependent methyltransferase